MSRRYHAVQGAAAREIAFRQATDASDDTIRDALLGEAASVAQRMPARLLRAVGCEGLRLADGAIDLRVSDGDSDSYADVVARYADSPELDEHAARLACWADVADSPLSEMLGGKP
ncbi:MAG TPA: hypothetical protein VJP80_01765 [Candidatus Saccharimonadales bacterium]|nr:hypothetical protein [Candidatus Saccharimonadales bacterium]